MSINPKVKDIIVEQLGVDPEKVKSEASFIDDLGADSLDIVELVMAMEEECLQNCLNCHFYPLLQNLNWQEVQLLLYGK